MIYIGQHYLHVEDGNIYQVKMVLQTIGKPFKAFLGVTQDDLKNRFVQGGFNKWNKQ